MLMSRDPSGSLSHSPHAQADSPTTLVYVLQPHVRPKSTTWDTRALSPAFPSAALRYNSQPARMPGGQMFPLESRSPAPPSEHGPAASSADDSSPARPCQRLHLQPPPPPLLAPHKPPHTRPSHELPSTCAVSVKNTAIRAHSPIPWQFRHSTAASVNLLHLAPSRVWLVQPSTAPA